MSKKIMILEDDEATAELIKFYLQEEGLQVAISTKGKDFMAKVAEYQPDLITLDILLPDANGFSIFKKLQQDERTKNIPVIFCQQQMITQLAKSTTISTSTSKGERQNENPEQVDDSDSVGCAFGGLRKGNREKIPRC